MERNEKFDDLMHMEWEVRQEQTGVSFGIDAATRGRAVRNLRRAKERLYAAVDALSLEELKSFAEYRRAVRAELG